MKRSGLAGYCASAVHAMMHSKSASALFDNRSMPPPQEE
jgi:hypothetical protein